MASSHDRFDEPYANELTGGLTTKGGTIMPG